VLVENSNHSRASLKRRLYDHGLKERRCELCGQDESWYGRPMSLILDHINGISTDNRLENLRIVCPNCAATLETHCGRKNRLDPKPQAGLHCAAELVPRRGGQKYCSQACGVHSQGPRRPKPEARKVPRPSYDQLMADMSMNYSAVGRTDVDRAKTFYGEKLGFNVDADRRMSETFRVLQLTPPGSACSIVIGEGVGDSPPGSARLQLCVADIEAAHAELVERGADALPIVHFEEGGQVEGKGGAWDSCIFFKDPDGNNWAIQERPSPS
jgi:catechol 2,3-dioxygenase-like lactoylglutathione lyase family enzyme